MTPGTPAQGPFPSPSPASSGARVDVLGVGFDPLDLPAGVREIERRLEAGLRTFVITANPEFVMLARREPDVAALARRADLVLPDGTGVVVASRILGYALPGRAPGRLLVDALAPRLVARGLSVFLLGAAPGIAARAAERLRRRVTGLRVAGTYAGQHDDDGDTVARVAAAAPGVLLVAYGMPRQERWIARNIDRLPSVRLAIGVGGVFDQLAGTRRVPPALVHRAGLEWLWRLGQDPSRWRRQRVLPLFAAGVLSDRLRGGRALPDRAAVAPLGVGAPASERSEARAGGDEVEPGPGIK